MANRLRPSPRIYLPIFHHNRSPSFSSSILHSIHSRNPTVLMIFLHKIRAVSAFLCITQQKQIYIYIYRYKNWHMRRRRTEFQKWKREKKNSRKNKRSTSEAEISKTKVQIAGEKWELVQREKCLYYYLGFLCLGV